MTVEILQGDVLARLADLADGSVNCCVTSPPYWGLRDYGTGVWEGGSADCAHSYNHGVQGSGGERATRTFTAQAFYRDVCGKCSAVRVDHQIGLEPTPELYIEKMTSVFREVRRVLRDDGTCWVNIGDSYNNREGQRVQGDGIRNDVAGWKQSTNAGSTNVGSRHAPNLKPKDLVGIPWMLAFALRADGWYLRSEIIWAKPNPMPESVRDRPTKAHEQLFLLTKSQKYYYDAEAIQEKASDDTHARYARGRSDTHKWADGGPGNQTIAKSFEHMRDRTPAGWHQGSRPATPQGILDQAAALPKQDQVGNRRYTGFNERWDAKERDRRDGVNPKCAEPGSGIKQKSSFSAAVKDVVESRNKRSVWTIPTQPFPEAHFATFPEKLVEPCVMAGCPKDGIVLDPFCGSGTVGLVARRLGCSFVGIELNPEYIWIAQKRLSQEVLDFSEVGAEA